MKEEISRDLFEEFLKNLLLTEEFYSDFKESYLGSKEKEKKNDSKDLKKEEIKEVPESFGQFLRFACSDGAILYLNVNTITAFYSKGDRSELVTAQGVYSVKERLDQVIDKIRHSAE